MDALLEALKQLAAGTGDKAKVVTLLKEHAGGVHQAVFQEGYNGGYGKRAGELETATAKVTELTAENTQLKTDLTAARDKNPELAKIHEQHANQVRQLTETHKTELAAVEQKLNATNVAAARTALANELVALGVDPDYARTVIVNRDDVAPRITVDKASGEVQYLQAGQSIPIVVSGDKSAAQLLAAELHAKVEPKWLTSNADNGAGGGSGGGGGGGSAGAAQKLADQIRKEAVDRRAAEAGTKAGPGGVPDGIAHLAVTGN